MKPIFTLLITLFAVAAHAQGSTSQMPELKDLEVPLLKCTQAKSGPEGDQCMFYGLENLLTSLKAQLNDDCRWDIWNRESDRLCGEKAEYEGRGSFYGRRLNACRVTQNLLLYGEFLDQKLGGNRSVNEKLLDLYNDPDAPQLFLLQELRKKILDKNSKEVKCEQRPMV